MISDSLINLIYRKHIAASFTKRMTMSKHSVTELNVGDPLHDTKVSLLDGSQSFTSSFGGRSFNHF